MKKKLHISNNMILFVILILLIILFGVLIPDGIFFNPSVLIGTTSDIAYLGNYGSANDLYHSYSWN